MKLSDGFNGADLRNVCTEAGRSWRSLRGLTLSLTLTLAVAQACLPSARTGSTSPRRTS